MKFDKLSLSSDVFSKVWDLYRSSFPEDKQRSLGQQKELMNNKSYSLFGVSEDVFVGFIAVWDLKDFYFIEQMLILPIYQGMGFGTIVLSELFPKDALVILEVDIPKSIDDHRRISFYEKSHFRTISFEYLRPSYDKNKKPVKTHLMSRPTIDKKTFEKVKKTLYKEVYNK